MIADNIRLQYTETRKPEIVLSIKEGIEPIQEYKDIISKGKLLQVDIKQYRIKRSTDANSYMWLLLSKLAVALHTTKDELYLLMLERYGIFTHLIVKKSVVERVKQEWRTVRELGEVTIGGQTGVQLQCYFGSSGYDTKEMSVLIDGVVSECKEVGIETMTPAELELIKSEWGR